jgi:uncharacterized repeat protein (TIGR03847 family)
VGPPGQRVFYLQAREGRRLVTLKCEKEQVSALGEYLAGLLAKLAESAPPAAAGKGPALVEPLEPLWPVGSIGVGYDEGRQRIIVVANEQVEEDEESATPAAEPASARFAITRAQAAAFVERARALVRAGRPTCPMCGAPKDPAGHVCPRANGHVVHKE